MAEGQVRIADEDRGAIGDEGGGRVNKMGDSVGRYSFGDDAIGGRAYTIGAGTEGRYSGEGSSGRAFIIGDEEGTGRKRICTIADVTD